MILAILVAGWAATASGTDGSASSPGRPVLSPAPSSVLSGWEAPAAPAGDQAWRRSAVLTSYAALYGGAAKVGSRLGLSSDFKIVRLESAYAYDVVAHVYNTQQLGILMGALHEWVGLPRSLGAWGGAFGSLTAMEILNGFMPRVRFDPLDPPANALGAWLATGGRDLAREHPHLRRLSLEFGYKSWARVFGQSQAEGFLGNVWHDYPNGRFGLGYAIGPAGAPWFTVFGTYEITSWDVRRLRNRLGIGVELKPTRWLAPWLEALPGGAGLIALYEWLDARILMPGVYLQLAHLDLGPFSGRQPFEE